LNTITAKPAGAGVRRPRRHVLAAAARYAWFRVRFRRHRLDVQPFVLESGALLEIDRSASVRIGRGVVMRRNALLQVRGDLSIGARTFFNQSLHLCCFDRVTIGRECRFGELVSIHDENHLVDAETTIDEGRFTTAPIHVGDRVWIGAKATILGGVTIGDDAVVAAHAVVVRDVPAGALVGGVPAKVIRSR